MRRLAALPSSAVEYWRKIVKSKRHPHRKSLDGILKKIETSYEQYACSAPELPLIPVAPLFGFTREEVDALHSAYEETVPVNQLKKDLRTAAGETRVCCYCQIDDGPTFDHVLPISVWPELSVCSTNLVPICGSCNLLKLTKVLDGNGARLFVNCHLDEIPNVRWLFAVASRRADKIWIDYSLAIPPEVPMANIGGVVERHYRELKLLERYRERTGDVLATFRATMSDQSPHQIHAKADNLRVEYGMNYFKAAAYDALADLLTSEQPH